MVRAVLRPTQDMNTKDTSRTRAFLRPAHDKSCENPTHIGQFKLGQIDVARTEKKDKEKDTCTAITTPTTLTTRTAPTTLTTLTTRTTRTAPTTLTNSSYSHY